MVIKTVPHRPCSPDLAPCNFCLFPKLRDCRYEIIEEMKEAVTKVMERLTQEDFHWSFQKLLEQYNKCSATGGDYFEGDKSFMDVLWIKVPIRKKSGNLSCVPRKYSYIRFFLVFLLTNHVRNIIMKWTFIQVLGIFCHTSLFHQNSAEIPTICTRVHM